MSADQETAVNPYQTPEAAVTEPDASAIGGFYVVSIKKFYILYFLTFSLYQVYWFYKHWQQYKLRNQEPMWPVMRAIFQIFFVHSLYSKLDFVAEDKDVPRDWSPGGLATGVVLLMIFSVIVDRLSYMEIGSPVTDLLSLAVMLVMPFLLVPAQRIANAVCGDPEGWQNCRITGLNIFWILLGICLWLLVLVGIFIVFAEYL